MSSHGAGLVPKLHFIILLRSNYKVTDQILNVIKANNSERLANADFNLFFKNVIPLGFVTVTREQQLCNGAHPTSC